MGVAGAALRTMLARVGEEKERARSARSGPPGPGESARRVDESLRLFHDQAVLRQAWLVARLGDIDAVRERLRRDEEERLASQQTALLAIQDRLYRGVGR